MRIVEDGKKPTARKEVKKHGNEARETAGHGKAGHTAASSPKVKAMNLYAVGEEESEINEEAINTSEELQAWCFFGRERACAVAREDQQNG